MAEPSILIPSSTSEVIYFDLGMSLQLVRYQSYLKDHTHSAGFPTGAVVPVGDRPNRPNRLTLFRRAPAAFSECLDNADFGAFSLPWIYPLIRSVTFNSGLNSARFWR